jgi:hypothetical protein
MMELMDEVDIASNPLKKQVEDNKNCNYSACQKIDPD